MKKRRWLAIAIIVAGVVLASVLASRRWSERPRNVRNELLAMVPADADAIVYVDLATLRNSEFLKELIAWAAKPAEDSQYAQFVRDTGFDYERDLDAAAIAIENDGENDAPPRFFAAAQGRFDTQKIDAYAAKTGERKDEAGYEVFHVPLSGERGEVSFAFEGKDRILLTNDAAFWNQRKNMSSAMEAEAWRTRFDLLAGSPIFAVLRRDASAASALAQQGPGGFRSPQLASLISQLPWITIAGKPDGPQMVVVLEGETPDSSLAQQLSDFLKGIVVLAEAGLNDPKVLGHLDAEAEEAYQELLKSTYISRVDRGEMKSVRVVLTITPKLLAAARTVPLQTNAADQQKPKHKEKKEKSTSARTVARKH